MSFLLAGALLSGASTGISMWQQGKARKYNQAMEVYRNGMRKLQDAHTQDALTINEIYSSITAKNQNLANDIEYQGTTGTLAVRSAVSGFSGRTSRAISNAALRAKQLKSGAIEETYIRSRRDSDIKRLNSAFGTQVSLEDGYVKPVNYLGMALGATADVVGAME